MRRSLIVAVAALGMLALCASTGLAAERVKFEEFEISGPPPPEPVKDACGVAVDSGGRVFVSSYYGHHVDVFTPSHEASVALETPGSLPGPCDLAVDQAGDVYVNLWHGAVLKYRPNGVGYLPPVTVDPGPASGVAVEPTSEDVLVDHRTYVAEYEPSGSPVMAGLEPLKIGLGSLEEGFGLAVSEFAGDEEFEGTAGLLYVADAAGGGSVKVYRLAEPTVLVQTIGGGGTPQHGFVDLADADIAVDPADGHVYVTDNLGPGSENPQLGVDEFSPAGRFRETVPADVELGRPSPVTDAEPSGLATFGGRLYVSSGNYFSEEDPLHRTNGKVVVYNPPTPIKVHALTVAKTGSGEGLVTSGLPGIGCGDACSGEFKENATVVLTAAPAPGSRFAGWSGCPTTLSGMRCEMFMNADLEVGAAFETVPQLPLSLAVGGTGSGKVTSLPAGIECAHACEAGFDEGAEVTLVAAPDAGSETAGWSGCEAEPTPQSCEVTMSAARSITATFAPVPPPPAPPLPPPMPRTLSVLTTGTGSATGTVTSEPAGIDCAACSRAFAEGSVVTLLARPAPGSSFLGWGGCDSSAAGRCTVALGADRTVVAAFGPGSPGPLRVGAAVGDGPERTLTVTVPAAGELTASGKDIRPVAALGIAAGKVALRVRLDGPGARALRRAKASGLRRKVALVFTPFDGGAPVQMTRSVTFKWRGRSG